MLKNAEEAAYSGVLSNAVSLRGQLAEEQRHDLDRWFPDLTILPYEELCRAHDLMVRTIYTMEKRHDES